jgi:hypothetical protein
MIEVYCDNTTYFTVSRKVDEEGNPTFGIAILRDRPPLKTGESDPTWEQGKPLEPKENDILIWFGHEQWTRVLQDALNLAICEAKGYVELPR